MLMGEFPPHEVPFIDAPQPSEPTRSLAMVLAYCGDQFAGWQVQPGRATVQGVTEAALAKLCNQEVRIQASGRTDAGVHALGQVASFKTSSKLDLKAMKRGLKALLGERVHLRALGEVGPDFHARYSVQAKTYVYYLWPGAAAPLFLPDRLWPLKKALDPAPVRDALKGLVGEHDLAALASAGSEVQGSTVRRISQAKLVCLPGGLWRVELTATGFLRHVVRNLVGVLFQIGRGDLQPAHLHEMLAVGKRTYAGPKAPPGGLYLSRVFYQQPGPNSQEEAI
jgi:tRNA pseudouridine38-40 synthase